MVKVTAGPTAGDVGDSVSVSASSMTVVSPKAIPGMALGEAEAGPLMICTAVGLLPETTSWRKKWRCVSASVSSARAAGGYAAQARARREKRTAAACGAMAGRVGRSREACEGESE